MASPFMATRSLWSPHAYPPNPSNSGAHHEETNAIGKDITRKVMDALHDPP